MKLDTEVHAQFIEFYAIGCLRRFWQKVKQEYAKTEVCILTSCHFLEAIEHR